VKDSVFKRFLACVLAMIMLLSLAACGGAGQTQEQTGEFDETIPTTTYEPIVTKPTTKPTTQPTTKPSTSGTVKIYASVPSDWSAFCWAWGSQGDAFDVWPGVAMGSENGWYVVEVPNWVSGVIISNGSGVQTADLAVTEGKDVWIVVNSDASAQVSYSKPNIAVEDTTGDTVTVYAYVPANWLTPFCWAWGSKGDAFNAWPGKAMVQNGDWYEIKVPNWIDSLIINDKGNIQTEDLSVTKGKDLWVVVKVNGEVEISYSEPTLDIDKPSTQSIQHSDMQYVMIYNPGIYDSTVNWDTSSLETGVLASLTNSPVNTLDASAASSVAATSLAAVSGPYKVGDSKEFYCAAGSIGAERTLRKMTCTYVGQYCYVWGDSSVSSSVCQTFGKTFDNDVYTQMTSTFGPVEWLGEQKVHLMLYPFEGGTAGYFSPLDMLSSDYCSAADATAVQGNRDHNMLHFNSNHASANLSNAKAILSHEFQHMLCYCATRGANCQLWFNEALSAYAEELMVPGIKKSGGFVQNYNDSFQYARGNSLYHFTNLSDGYGLVYCFAEYLYKNGGNNVFAKIYEAFRSSYSTISESKAIYNAVSSDFRNQIDNSFDYSGIRFATKEDAWMSKLVLNFYLNMLSKEGNLPYHSAIKTGSLIYKDGGNQVVEGGGRIILSTGGSFDIPGGADAGLIYIGLDKDFQVVTTYIGK
jgi:hypothetical protein